MKLYVPERATAELDRQEQRTHKRSRSGLIVVEQELGLMHGRDRNKPCPCRSGRKFKRCHGRMAP